MKRNNTKTLMVFTILFTSIVSMPSVVNGQQETLDNSFELYQINPGIFQGFRKGIGDLFSQNLGYAGKILGAIFNTLLLQGLNLSAHETLDNVYVLSANTTEKITGKVNFTPSNNKEYYFLPNDYELPPNQGFAYCEVTKTGSYSYDLERGVAVTLVIWDNDKSFITAINKLLNFFKKIIYYENVLQTNIPRKLIQEGISTITWFLIHINDIFTGDELFVLNPITWQKLSINPIGYTIDKEWKLSGNNYAIDAGDNSVPALNLQEWEDNATTWKDSYMQWLLTDTLPGDLASTTWTHFSFDLIQLWIKDFEIHIDVAEILNAASGSGTGNLAQTIASAFNGCDIELFLFTHHFAGAFLYDDATPDGRISSSYTNVTNAVGQNVLYESGDPVQVPDRSELTHRLILNDVENFIFRKPIINRGDKSISWGLTLENANLSAVPMFVDLDSYLKAPIENLEYIYFGFTFIPTKDEELGVAKGIVKLDQQFAPWNGGTGPNAIIPGLDLAIIYVSTILHFHLNVDENEVFDDRAEHLLNENEDYIESSNELKVGNYLGRRAAQKLDFVDIAGPFYEYGSDRSSAIKYNASTNIMPLFLWKWEMERHDTFELGDGSTSKTFASDIRVNTEFTVMVYAVCYPEFNGLALGIWHDPSFSVYMVFSSTEFWALIVLVAGIALVGIATILIKRRKDSRF